MKKPNWMIWLKNKEECRIWLEKYLKKRILRKSSKQHRLYLEKSNHNLVFANWIYEKHKDDIPKFFGEETFYDWAINIYYYAVYHAALALVSKQGYESKNHSATLCFLIYNNFHLEKTIDKDDVELIAASLNKEDIEIIGMSKKLRERASYDVHEIFEKRLAQQAKEQAVDFVNKIKELLEFRK
jgi:uncharacterized protein (UPF0332 family)